MARAGIRDSLHGYSPGCLADHESPLHSEFGWSAVATMGTVLTPILTREHAHEDEEADERQGE
jgi:hypothetical protein